MPRDVAGRTYEGIPATGLDRPDTLDYNRELLRFSASGDPGGRLDTCRDESAS